jgi:hypothetical protein
MAYQGNRTLWGAIALCALWAGLACCVAALIVWIWQAYEWAQRGSVPDISFLDGLRALNGCEGFSCAGWLSNPQSWLGIHDAFEKLGLGIGLLFSGFAMWGLMLLTSNIDERVRAYAKTHGWRDPPAPAIETTPPLPRKTPTSPRRRFLRREDKRRKKLGY